MENRIFRSLGRLNRDIAEGSRRIEGQAIIYDSWSRDLGGFIEKINRGAVSEELLANSDVIANVNHDNDQMLARYVNGEGTLSLELREDGLYFSFDAPETERGNEILWNVSHGNYFECSFACMLNKSDVKRYREGDSYVQEITNISRLMDVSIVTHAAYPETSVSARSEEEAKAEFEDIKREVDEAEAAERAEQERIEQEKRTQEILDDLDRRRTEFLSYIEQK